MVLTCLKRSLHSHLKVVSGEEMKSCAGMPEEQTQTIHKFRLNPPATKISLIYFRLDFLSELNRRTVHHGSNEDTQTSSGKELLYLGSNNYEVDNIINTKQDGAALSSFTWFGP